MPRERMLSVAANNNELHPVDRRILAVLQGQGRIPNVQLAAEVGLSPSSVLERVRKLEDRGIIQKSVTLVDNKRVGFATVAFVAVSLNLHQKDSIENFHRFVDGCAKVLECHHVAGTEDYLLKVYSRDIDTLWVAGRCISADHGAQGPIRIIPACVMIGEAAGTAAALALKHEAGSPRELSADVLVDRLVKQGVALRDSKARLP